MSDAYCTRIPSLATAEALLSGVSGVAVLAHVHPQHLVGTLAIDFFAVPIDVLYVLVVLSLTRRLIRHAAEELGERVAATVGYSIRFEGVSSKRLESVS
jgi:hypothetical protein